MPLFSWVTFSGETGQGDSLPQSPSDFESIAELILHRDHTLKPAASHPAQEAVMKKLPPNLQVLRAEYCRLRTFPVLPESILEVYFRQNDAIIVPDLTHLNNCIVMEFGDNRVEELNCALMPPPLTRVGFPVNALSVVKNTLPEFCLNWDFTGNPSRCRFDIGQYCSKGTGTSRSALYKMSDSALKKVNAFANEQSSHNPSVQKSAELNCAHIISYRPEVPFMSTEALLKSIKQTYMDSELKSPIPLLKPFLDGFYSQNGTTLERLVERLWLRISDAEGETQKELLKRFAEELEDADLKCSNGVMVRLANNVLIGFDDAIKMRATNNEILSMRVPNTIRRVLIGHKMDTPQERLDYWQRVYIQTIADLEDVEEPRKDWIEWLQPISEEILHIAASQLSLTSIDDIEQTSVMLKESYKLLGDLWEVTMLQEILAIPENMRPGASSSSTDYIKNEKKYYYNLALRVEKRTITRSETEKLRKYLSTECFGCLVWIDFVHALEHDATNTIQIIVEATQSKDHNRYLISVTESGDVTHTPLPSHKDISDEDVCLYLISSCLSLEFLGGPPVDEPDVQRLKDRIGFYYHIDPTTIKVQCIPSDTMKTIKINIFQVQDGFIPFCVFTILLNAKGEIVLDKYKGNGVDGYINDVPLISTSDIKIVLE